MEAAAQLSRLAGVHHIVNTQGSLDRVSDERVEVVMAVIDQMFAETVAFHLKPTGLIDRLMERFRAIATDPHKCPEGKVSWKRNRSHLGRDLRDRIKKRDFDEALALLAETVGKNNLGCFLGICFGVCVWMMFVGSIPVGGTSANDMDGFPALLLKIFLYTMTPVATLPALMTYGPGKK